MNKLGMFGNLTDIQRDAWKMTLGVPFTPPKFANSSYTQQYEQALSKLSKANMEKIYELPPQSPTAGLGNNQNNYKSESYRQEIGLEHKGNDIGGGSITKNNGTIKIFVATSGIVAGTSV